MPLLATVGAAEDVRAREALGSGRNGMGLVLGVALAALRMIAVLIPRVRPAADRAATSLATGRSRVTPLSTVRTERDTGLAVGGVDVARTTEDVDALIVERSAAGSGLGIPNVEEHQDRGGRWRLLDDTGVARREIHLAQRRRCEGGVDVDGSGEVPADAILRHANYLEIADGLRKADVQVLLVRREVLSDPTPNHIEFFGP